MADSSPDAPHLQSVIPAVALTVAAGFVDAFGFLTLNGVYTANMSGNTVLVGVYGFATEGSLALHAFTIAMFVLGLVVSGLVVELGLRSGIRRSFALAMSAEALLLIALLAYGWFVVDRIDGAAEGWRLYTLVALAAVAMGAQNTSLRTAGILTAYTTHVTGTITKFAEHAVEWLLARGGSAEEAGKARASGRGALLCVALWAGFLGGAALAAVLHQRAQALGLMIPLAIVAATAVADLVSPLARAAAGRPR